MTEDINQNRELKKMKRVDLLDIMVRQSKENESLKNQLAEALEELNERKIQISEAGSIAEAALQLNGVFEAVEKSGAQYLENIARLSAEKESINARIIEESEKKAAELISETQAKCDKLEKDAAGLMAETQVKCEQLERDTKIKCEGMVLQAEKESEEYWDKVSEKLESFYKQHREIKDIMSLIGEKGRKS